MDLYTCIKSENRLLEPGTGLTGLWNKRQHQHNRQQANPSYNKFNFLKITESVMSKHFHYSLSNNPDRRSRQKKAFQAPARDRQASETGFNQNKSTSTAVLWSIVNRASGIWGQQGYSLSQSILSSGGQTSNWLFPLWFFMFMCYVSYIFLRYTHPAKGHLTYLVSVHTRLVSLSVAWDPASWNA